jgi:hypothetical protein
MAWKELLLSQSQPGVSGPLNSHNIFTLGKTQQEIFVSRAFLKMGTHQFLDGV